MSATPVSLAALVLAVALAFALGQGQGQGADGNAFYLQPDRVEAGSPDTLNVVSYRYGCGTAFSAMSLQRTGSRIAVRFAATERPEIVCPAVYRPYGPAFALPALPEGRYDVYATALHPCQVAPQPCDLPEKEERVGILTAGPAAAADWFLSPASAPANRAFTLRLLSGRYGNCGTRFEHASLTRSGTRLTARFVIVEDTSVVCIADIRPHGPAFESGPLPVGKYPVDVIETPACVYAPQPCPWLPPEQVARTVDTLVVTAALPVIPSRAAPGAGGSSAGRAGLMRAGGTLAVTHPEGAGLRDAGTADLRGRRLPVLPGRLLP